MTSTSPEPVLFISYSQTSEAYKEKVLEFANRLIDAGVDVLLDQYELDLGSNLNAYMERSITDPRVTHVLALCDEAYKEKSEGRRGGVGTETTIISTKVYEQLSGPKREGARGPRFIAVRFAPGDVLPAMFASSLYVDLSDPGSAQYGEQYETLLRALHNRPARIKPALGQIPAFLNEATAVPASPSAAHATAVLEAVRGERWPSARSRLGDYLNALEAELRALPMAVAEEGEHQGTYLQDVVRSALSAFLPARNAFAGVVHALGPAPIDTGLVDALVAFFERVRNVAWDASRASKFNEAAQDYKTFLVTELLLYASGSLYKAGAYAVLSDLLGRSFYVVRPSTGGHEYVTFADLTSFPRNTAEMVLSEGTRWISPIGYLLISRAAPSVLSQQELCQTEAMLWWRAHSMGSRWFPLTMYAWGSGTHLPAFGRAESKRWAGYLATVLGYASVELMKADVPKIARAFDEDRKPMMDVSVDVLALDRIGRRP
ncbi:SEFIR domain-containing protein [Deinococcus humi]|uniref:SEFIR domain-containing protein n=1 Tax=Deinococcus humi TaxID=662880 RepID=A0A7W8K000_9DEIO|nr:hypothetical protein [Deinococcus humi]